MRVTGPTLTQPASRRRTERAGDQAGGTFASALGGDEPTSGAGPVGPIATVEMLLSIQEVANEGGGRRRARARGEAILDSLDNLRLGLLTGRFSERELGGLLDLVRQRRESIADPGLREVLEAIELRACVELAKLGQPV
ncbi:MAG: flagellar assembly protein FliX [Rhodospirillales bacterium]